MSAELEPEQIRPGLWCIPMPMPGPLRATLAYAVLADDGVHLIDPGWDTSENAERLGRVLTGLGRSAAEIRTVVVTHHHPDHIGLAARLRRDHGVRVVLSQVEREVLSVVADPAHRDLETYRQRLEGWGVPAARQPELVDSHASIAPAVAVEPDGILRDGDVVRLGERMLTVLLTPGHTGGHVCLVDDADEVIFTGDHVLPEVYAGIGLGILPGTEPVGALIASLDRLAPYDDYEVLPGHGHRFRDLGARRRRIAAHHLRRLAEIAALVPELGDAPVWEYAARLTWTLGWEGLRGFARHSALHQTELHLRALGTHGADALVARGLSSG